MTTLREAIQFLPEMVAEPNPDGWSLVRRKDVLALLDDQKRINFSLPVSRLHDPANPNCPCLVCWEHAHVPEPPATDR